jgi:DNA-binding HxlR family transcriptional regulator
VSNNHHQSTKQLDILSLLYRFRFATSNNLTQALNSKRTNTINQRLKLLLQQDYIGRKYEPSYRLLGKHASYYLLPKGISALKQIPDNKFDKTILHNIHKDKTASDQFIDYSLGIFSTYCQLKAKYGDSLHFFTKSQLANKYDYFSEFLPSIYIRLDINGTEKDYFLEYLQTSKPYFTVIQRLKQYIEYASNGDWEAGTESDFPKILLVCDTPSLQNRLLKRAGSILNEADEELKFYTTTSSNLETWHNLDDQDQKSQPLTKI